MPEIIQVEVPNVGESISEVQIGQWLKAKGDWVDSGEDLVEIETEKASVQIPAPTDGYVESIDKESEEFASVGEVIASIRVAEKPDQNASQASDSKSAAANSDEAAPEPAGNDPSFVMPAAQRLLEENGLQASEIPASGPGGRLLKEDVLAYVQNQSKKPSTTPPRFSTGDARTTPRRHWKPDC